MRIIQEHIRIARLVVKRWLGALTEEEALQLQAWEEGGEGRAEACESLRHVSPEQLSQRYEQIDSTEEWRVFRQRLVGRRRNLRLRMVGVAAGICLVAGVAFWWQLEQEMEQAVPVQKVEGIHLILSNGQVFDLSDGQGIDFQGVEGSVVLNDGGLAYKADSVGGERAAEYNTLVVPKGAFYTLELSDGTKIWLNSDSKITYPVRFVGGLREVKLLGEAFFDVAKQDVGQPFRVQAGGLQVEVLGTAFNVNVYGDGGKFYVALQEGKVVASREGGECVLALAPGEVAELDVTDPESEVVVSPMSLQEQLAWREGMFCFRQTSLKDILKQIERYYNVRFSGMEHGMNEVFTGDISMDVELRELLDAIALQTAHWEFKVVGDVVYILKKDI